MFWQFHLEAFSTSWIMHTLKCTLVHSSIKVISQTCIPETNNCWLLTSLRPRFSVPVLVSKSNLILLKTVFGDLFICSRIWAELWIIAHDSLVHILHLLLFLKSYIFRWIQRKIKTKHICWQTKNCNYLLVIWLNCGIIVKSAPRMRYIPNSICYFYDVKTQNASFSVPYAQCSNCTD